MLGHEYPDKFAFQDAWFTERSVTVNFLGGLLALLLPSLWICRTACRQKRRTATDAYNLVEGRNSIQSVPNDLLVLPSKHLLNGLLPLDNALNAPKHIVKRKEHGMLDAVLDLHEYQNRRFSDQHKPDLVYGAEWSDRKGREREEEGKRQGSGGERHTQ
jgi:hypothetical protein